MKKGTLINGPLSSVVAQMGHKERLVVADAGLPLGNLPRIDLALTAGIPSFVDTLRVLMSELQVEAAIYAEELPKKNPEVYLAMMQVLGDIPMQPLPHEQFKVEMRSSRAAVRTGEFSPYANVILISGVIY
jgi:D-ribose pyranase